MIICQKSCFQHKILIIKKESKKIENECKNQERNKWIYKEMKESREIKNEWNNERKLENKEWMNELRK